MVSTRTAFNIQIRGHRNNIIKVNAFLALGPSVEYRWHEHSRYFIGKHKHTETGDINLNPIGVNIEARAGYSGVMLYARAGVTPLLNKAKAPECYPMTIGLGFRL